MKRLSIAAVILAIFAAFGLWWFSPTQVVKRRTQSLLSILTIDSGSGKITRQMGAYSLNKLLAPRVQLETPTIDEANGTFDRAEMESAFSWLCQQAKQLTLNGLVELPTYRPVDGNFFVTFDWKKSDDGWQLTHAKWEETP
jgi:hypothetical protein